MNSSNLSYQTLAGCSQGNSAKGAIEQVRAKRPGSIETAEQEALIEMYEQHRKNQTHAG